MSKKNYEEAWDETEKELKRKLTLARGGRPQDLGYGC